jgi:hypothetical protein
MSSHSFYRVYQYRPDQQPRDLETLVAKQLWSSSFDRLNDPFEVAAMRALADYPDKQSEFKGAGVTCFSRSVTNPLLWAHYAAGHVGFAIGYDALHFFFGYEQELKKRILHDVRYEDIAPTLERFPLDELPLAAVLTKPTCWAHEQEVRLIRKYGNQALDVPQEMIKEIMFGAAMSDARMKTIMAEVRAAGIEARFGWMRLLKEGYGVRPEWIAS